MDAGNPILQLLDPVDHIAACRLKPVGIQGEAHQFCRHLLQQHINDAPPVPQASPFEIMVMIHEDFPCIMHLLRRKGVILSELIHPLRCLILGCHHADADAVAAQRVMIPNDPIRVGDHPIRVGVGQHNLQPEFIANLPLRFHRNVADGRQLYTLVANVGNPLHGLVKVPFVLGVIANRKSLSTYQHDHPSSVLLR